MRIIRIVRSSPIDEHRYWAFTSVLTDATTKSHHARGAAVIALVLLGVTVLWAVLGFFLWKWLIKPRFRSRAALVAATLVAAVIWFVEPVLDEIIGAQTFKRLCEEMPPIEFYGPVAVGPGVFFAEFGNRKWKSIEELLAIRRDSKEWDDIFDVREENHLLLRWPVPVFESKALDFERNTGRPVVVSAYRASPGGWIKRVTKWGKHAPYVCRNKGTFPPDDSWIVFKTK
jgi:hypothetical protein